MKKNNSYSLEKIAQELGVSKATVSFVLSGKARERRIGKKTEQRILQYCRQKNYSPNIHAKRLNSSLTNVIGILLSPGSLREIQHPFADDITPHIVGGIMETAEKYGFRVIIHHVHPDLSSEEICDWFRRREIDGMLYYGVVLPFEWVRELVTNQYKVVAIGENPAYGLSTVNINNYEVSKELTRYLLKKGCKNLTFLNGRTTSYVNNERKRGFIEALKEEGISYEDCEKNYAFFQEKYAYKWIEEKILENKVEEDAIVCANDRMAIGVIKALKKYKIKVPDDIRVCGADGIELGEYFSPSLTTYSSCGYELGVKAFHLLYEMLTGTPKEKNIEISTDIIFRESA